MFTIMGISAIGLILIGIIILSIISALFGSMAVSLVDAKKNKNLRKVASFCKGSGIILGIIAFFVLSVGTFGTVFTHGDGDRLGFTHAEESVNNPNAENSKFMLRTAISSNEDGINKFIAKSIDADKVETDFKKDEWDNESTVTKIKNSNMFSFIGIKGSAQIKGVFYFENNTIKITVEDNSDNKNKESITVPVD